MKASYYIFGLLLLVLSACGSKKSSVLKHQTQTEKFSEDRQLNFVVIRSSDSVFRYTSRQLDNIQLWDLQGRVSITAEGLKTDRAIVQLWSQQTAESQSVEIQNLEEKQTDRAQSTAYQNQSLQTKDRKILRKRSVFIPALLLCIAIGGYVVYRKRK